MKFWELPGERRVLHNNLKTKSVYQTNISVVLSLNISKLNGKISSKICIKILKHIAARIGLTDIAVVDIAHSMIQ